MRLVELAGLTFDAAFVISTEQRIVVANEAAGALVGESPASLAGRPCWEVIAALHPNGERFCQSADCPVFQAISDRQPVPLEWTAWAAPDGHALPVSGTAIIAPPGGGQDEAALLIVHVGGPGSGHTTPVPEQPALELRLLGATTLLAQASTIPPPRRRRGLELLAYLVFAGRRGATRERLLDDFWPGVMPEVSAPRLRVLLHALRQLLDTAGLTGALQRQGRLYVLDGARLRLDAVAFEASAGRVLATDAEATDAVALERTLDMYRGDFGEGEHFGAWAVPEAQRLRGLYHELLERAATYFIANGAIQRGIECCHLALRSDPLQEQFQIALIAYYGTIGRSEDAVRQYEDYRRILAAEADTTPRPAMVRALRRVLEHA